jgi:hypothetical protein
MTCLNDNSNDYFDDGSIFRDDQWQEQFVRQEAATVETAAVLAKLIGHKVCAVGVGYDEDGDPELVTTSIKLSTGDQLETRFQISTN